MSSKQQQQQDYHHPHLIFSCLCGSSCRCVLSDAVARLSIAAVAAAGGAVPGFPPHCLGVKILAGRSLAWLGCLKELALGTPSAMVRNSVHPLLLLLMMMITGWDQHAIAAAAAAAAVSAVLAAPS
jgi:hypothetical protein